MRRIENWQEQVSFREKGCRRRVSGREVTVCSGHLFPSKFIFWEMPHLADSKQAVCAACSIHFSKNFEQVTPMSRSGRRDIPRPRRRGYLGRRGIPRPGGRGYLGRGYFQKFSSRHLHFDIWIKMIAGMVDKFHRPKSIKPTKKPFPKSLRRGGVRADFVEFGYKIFLF